MKQVYYWFVLTFTVLTIVACKTLSAQEKEKHEITVIGISKNAKIGAVIVTGNNLYYIDRLNVWKKNILDKKLKVTGVLKIEKFHIENEDGILTQGMEGEKTTLMNAHWKVIKN
jgi:hypothetical protein